MKKELEKLIKNSGLDPRCCVLRQVTRASRAIVAGFDLALAPAGVTGNQFTVLVVLAHAGPMSVNALAEAVGMHPSTTPRKIAPLLRDGLVRVGPGADRRRRLIGITEKGNTVLSRAYPLWAGLQRSVLQHLEPGAWPSIMQSLTAIRMALTH